MTSGPFQHCPKTRFASRIALPGPLELPFLGFGKFPKKAPNEFTFINQWAVPFGQVNCRGVVFSIYVDSNLRISFCCSLLLLPLLPLLSVFLLPLVLVLLLLWLLLFLVLLSPLWTTTTTTTTTTTATTTTSSSSSSPSPSPSHHHHHHHHPSPCPHTISTMATSRNSGPAI